MGQIDQFLDELHNDYSALYKENAALKAKMRVLVDKIDEYRAVDEEMRKALFTAQVTAREIVEKAQKEADATLASACTDAQRHVSTLQLDAEAEQRRLEEAKRACSDYAGRMRALLEKNIELMETIMERPVESFRADAPSQGQEYAPPVEPVAPPAPEAAPAPAAAEETVGADTQFFEISLGGEDEELASELDPELAPDEDSDTARIYGASPYTPKPRFNFTDLRFGKGYKEDDTDDK